MGIIKNFLILLKVNLVLLFLLPQFFIAQGAVNSHIIIGANYSHHTILNCSMDDTGIIYSYHQPGVRTNVQAQLSTMKKVNQIESLRLIVWHMTDIGSHRWGIIPSKDGKIADPYRTNLINYLNDIKNSQITRLTISFGPQWTNAPTSSNYDPIKFTENWTFIQDIRSLVKQYGPTTTRIDLLNEGAPSVYQPSHQVVTDYLKNIYTNYINVYGKADVTISSIGPSGSGGATDRLQNLISLIKATGKGYPNWFEIHIGRTENDAFADLQNAHQTLKTNKLSQPITVGETSYENSSVALGVKRHIQQSTMNRPLQEVMEWPLKADSTCLNISETPPYSANAYIDALP